MHDPTAVFFSAGGPIQHRDQRGRLHVLDIAPLLLYLAGQPIPDDLEGRLPLEILDPDFVHAHPPQKTAATPPRPHGGSTISTTAPENPELVRRLKALGYVN